MGKKKRDSSEKDEDYIRKKIRKLERKLKKHENDLNADTSSVLESQPTTSPPPSPTVQIEPVAGPSTAPEVFDQDLTNTESDQLPEEFLLALGTEGEDNTEVGESIRAELALRWSRIMSDGLGREPKNTILKKYPTPANFPRAEAPHMNAEIVASLSDLSLKRDKRIVNRQNITGKLMTCLGKSLTSLLKGNINSRVLIEEINDAAKLAAEIYYQDSSSRKFFALAGANKTIQEAVRNNKSDEFLFGVDCAEKIKAAQSIKRTSSQIKATTTVAKEPVKPTLKKQVNWKSPSQYQNQQHQRTRDGQYQHQTAFKRQSRFDHPHQRGRKRAPPRSRSRYQH